MSETAKRIRPSCVAGSFYEASPERLREDILSRLEQAPAACATAPILAAAAPHAGYVYSADIAAATYAALRQADFDTVVIIGHDFGSHARGIIAVTASYTDYATPLGNVPVDTELVQSLMAADSRIICNDRIHAQEHSIEVQLPFLQVVASSPFRIVPFFFGEVTPDHCQRLAELLMRLKGDRRLLVLSSTDLSHYPNDKTARKLDAKTVSFATALDLDGLCKWQAQGEWEEQPNVETPICSAGGLGTAICWARLNGPAKGLVLRQGNSGDASGDQRRVVGYAALLFVKAQDGEAAGPAENNFSLPAPLQRRLLALARKTIEDGARGISAQDQDGDGDDAALQEKAAVFVTLQKQGRLRGCIGTTEAYLPLCQAVMHFAHAAAFEDPRFEEVTADELSSLHIEISVLSPMRRIASPDEIIPFKHGVMVTRGGRRGLFLPQVWEQLPTKEMFLNYLCAEKAGLSFDAWKDPQTKLEVFTVFAFEE